MADDNLDEEDFDKPAKKKADTANKDNQSDDFEDDEKDDAADAGKGDADGADDVEVVEEDSDGGDAGSRRDMQHRSKESRFGKRRNKFRTRGRDAQYVRNLENTVSDLQRGFASMKTELDEVKQSNSRTNDANIDAQISEAQRYHEQAKTSHAQAVKDGDGVAAAEALDVMFEAREALNQLKTAKANPRTDSDKKSVDKTDTTSRPKVDPHVMRRFESWNSENDWFDPTLRDKYSRIAFHIDNAVKAEGFDPRTDEYWDELNSRLRENRMLSAAGLFEDDAGEEDEYEDRKENKMRDREPNRRPNPPTDRTPQHKNNGGKKKIVVSKMRADAMREMGLEPGTPQWNKMAKKYAGWDKQHASA